MVTSSKKRSASSQAGPKRKKVHVEEDHGTMAGKGVKRNQPVTRPVVVSDDDEEDSEEVDDVTENEELSEEDVNMEEDEEEDEVPNRLAKDTNCESHKAQKALLDQRRAQKPHSSLISDSKKRWSLLRTKNMSPSERQTHVTALMDIIRGKVKDIVFKHDASRIVQSLVKYGGSKEREEIAKELSGRFKELAQSKYSKFLVTKLIRLCPSQRASILLEFQSSVIRMLLHREASSVLADAFELYANAYERAILLREFYGKEALFSFTTGSEADKERAKKGLKGLLEGVDLDRRKRILTVVKENLVTMFNNSDKGAATHAIVHRALWEYLCAINDLPSEMEQEKYRREMFECCQEVMAEMVHTKDGSRAVREFLAQGNAKDRKQIVKVLKPHIERMCLNDEAQLVLFTALDVIDDTKLLSKSLVTAITSSAPKLYSTAQGRRSLLYVIVPRTRRHFTPAQISCLEKTDDIRARTSKKSAENREEEVRKAASEDLLAWVEKEGEKLVSESSGCLVVGEVMLYAEGDKAPSSETLLKALARVPSSNAKVIDLPPASRLYKTLLQGGHYSKSSHTIARVPPSMWDSTSFAVKFVTEVGKDSTVEMCVGQGNGAFVVAELVEALNRGANQGHAGAEEAKKTLRIWFDTKVVGEIENSQAKGKTVLIEKLGLL